MADGCRPVLERLGAPFTPETIVGQLSIAEQQLVEIARALHAKSKILVLDEPTTALSSRETERLFALIRQLRSEGHRADLHQPSHGRGLRAVGPGLGAARRHLCRHARPRRAHGRRAGQDDGRARPLQLLHQGARPARQPRPGDPRGQGHDRRRPAGEARELPAPSGRGAGHRRPGRLGPDRARPADLRRRPQGRRRGAAGRAAGEHHAGPRRPSTAASPT